MIDAATTEHVHAVCSFFFSMKFAVQLTQLDYLIFFFDIINLKETG